MNTVNASTGFTPFQLRFGKAPRILPPITRHNPDTDEATTNACEIIHHMQATEMEAQDHLIEAKTSQASAANAHHDLSFPFAVGDWVMLSTMHRRHEYKSTDSRRTAKFMPRFDRPYHIVATDKKHSTITLDLPDNPQMFPVFHTSEIKPFKDNDNELFPNRALHPPDPITINGREEFFIDKIVDQRRRGRGLQYRVRWQGEGPEGDKWFPARELEDCEALDKWQNHQGVIMATMHRSRSFHIHTPSPLPPVAFPTGVLTHPS